MKIFRHSGGSRNPVLINPGFRIAPGSRPGLSGMTAVKSIFWTIWCHFLKKPESSISIPALSEVDRGACPGPNPGFAGMTLGTTLYEITFFKLFPCLVPPFLCLPPREDGGRIRIHPAVGKFIKSRGTSQGFSGGFEKMPLNWRAITS